MIFLKQLIFPASSLWFIHQLLFFYVATRLLRRVPVLLVFGVAAVAHTALYAGLFTAPWSVIERFANWYVFFFAGYAFAPLIFSLAEKMRNHWPVALASLLTWGVWNGALVHMGYGDTPVVSLILGFAGAFAIVTVAALLARFELGQALRYAGKHSIVIYLTFFIPMKVAQKGLATTGLIPDIGTASLAILVFAVAVPLVFHWMIKSTPLNFLYVRPGFLRLGHGKAAKPAVRSLADPKTV
jgi:uncharacterized membrane protein YcfT